MSRLLFREEHDIFRDAFKKFLAKEVIPYLEEWEHAGIVPKEVWKKMGTNGFLCPWLDEKYGGSGVGFEYSVVINEELAYIGCLGLIPGLHSDIIFPYINSFGNDEQKEKWLPDCASGDIVTAIAMTEPGTGSDLAANQYGRQCWTGELFFG
jgi:acyl-CoA dehydrogenase